MKISRMQLRDLLENIIKNTTVHKFIDSGILPLHNNYIVKNSRYSLQIFELLNDLNINNIMYTNTVPREYAFTFLLNDKTQHTFLFPSKENRLISLEQCLYLIEKMKNK